MKGIHRDRAQRGAAALTLVTSSQDPYADTFDEAGARFAYAYRAGATNQPDNRALRAAFALQTLHQQRFKLDVMRAYRHRCAICALREQTLVQAARIVPDVEPEGSRPWSTGSRAVRHPPPGARSQRARDRSGRRRAHRPEPARRDRRADASHRAAGLHGAAIALPRRPEDRPDPARLEARFKPVRAGRRVRRPDLAYDYHMMMARTQTLVQLSDDLLERLDRLRDREGRSRSELIREAVEQYLAVDEEAEIDRLVVEAYTRRPPEDAWADEAARRMIATEPW
jgi:predicted transcriptional regulator